VENTNNDKATTPAPELTQPVEPVYSSLIIRIEYSLEEPRNGVVFVQKDEEIAPYVSITIAKPDIFFYLTCHHLIAIKSCIYC
jgi:hypothetical protein